MLRAMLFACDVPRLRAFYAAVLGTSPCTDGEGWVEFEVGGARLALHAIPASIAAGIAIATPPEVREESALKLVLGVPDPKACAARVAALGGLVLPRPWGAPDFADPEGNVFGVVADERS